MRILVIIIMALSFSGCNTRIAWENGKFTIDPFGGKFSSQQQVQNGQQQNQTGQQQNQNAYIINNQPVTHQPNNGYSATSPNHSMIQFNANRHTFGNL